ncbi:MAG: cytochrome c biogenesis protein ResB [Deferrisomatales bacterium]
MTTPSRGPWARLAAGLSSLKLSIFCFFALAGTSIFGTVIQQQADPRAYLESYGPGVAAVLQALGLVDMYHSWWFQLLLSLLLVNTLVCSLRRLPAALQSIRPGQFAAAADLATKPVRATWRSRDGAAAEVEAAMRRHFGRPATREEGGATTWFAQRQPWARLGAYVAHASLVLFFLGGIVGARYGYKGFVNIPEGSTVSTFTLRGGGEMALPFQVRCDKFELHSYPDGRPKDYLSHLAVTKNGQVVQQKTIEVNDPLVQDGFFLYQSSYGSSGGGAVLRVLGRDGQERAAALRAPEGQPVPLPGSDLAVEVLQTTDDYQGFGPAAQVVLLRPDGNPAGDPFLLLQGHPQFDQRRGGEQVFQLSSLLPGRWYTGLQVAKDPGVPLIWAGSILITLGTCMAFFASHRRVWVRLEGGQLTVAGNASKHPGTFREEFSALEAALRECTETQTGRRTAAG